MEQLESIFFDESTQILHWADKSFKHGKLIIETASENEFDLFNDLINIEREYKTKLTYNEVCIIGEKWIAMFTKMVNRGIIKF